MPSIDMPIEEMRRYKPSLYREDDFESFWRKTIADAVAQPINAELIPYNLPTAQIECYAVRFDGFKGGRIAGWYLRPGRNARFPAVCSYHGYSGRAVRPLDLIYLAAQGMCVLSIDTRGQCGQSQDAARYPEGHQMGWMTQGIRDPQTYYYRYVYADCVRAIEMLGQREEVDASRLAITGASQGGGLTLAVAALSQRPVLAMPDVPYLCDYRRAVAITQAGPYLEIPSFLRSFPELYAQAFRTLSYFDNLNLAPLIKCRTIISNSLWDDVCPPSTVFGVYNHITAEKQIELYPFHRHEVPYEHRELQYRTILEMLRP